jgi:pSer/pThr/pTyr-binding forkhead associated (FHA) protein
MARFIDLEVIGGPEQGMRYTIESGTYRVLGRAGDETASTVQLDGEGDRLLDDDQRQVVDRMFATRAARGVRTRFKKRGADILLHDGSISRTHALVFCDDVAISVADLMSTNGTKVNGAPVQDTDVHPGDVVHLGQTKMKVVDG